MVKIFTAFMIAALASQLNLLRVGQTCANFISNFSIANFVVEPYPVTAGVNAMVNMTGTFSNSVMVSAINIELMNGSTTENIPTTVNQTFANAESTDFLANFTAESGPGVWTVRITLVSNPNIPQCCWQFSYMV